MLASYLGMLAWQIIWHGMLPAPLGAQNAWLALLASLPLLIPLFGLVRFRYRSMVWSGLLLLFYMTIGVMEAWSNPPQRGPAVLQILLAVYYVYAFKRRNQAIQKQ